MAALTDEDVKDIINAKTDKILEMFDLSVGLKAALRRENVITPDIENKLKVASKTEQEKIEEILTSIRQRGLEPFIKFCKVLSEKDHKHVLNVMGVMVQGDTITVRKVSGQQVQMQISAALKQLAAGETPGSTPLAGATNYAGATSVKTPPAGLPSEGELDELFKKKLSVFYKLDINAVFMMELLTTDVLTAEMIKTINSKPTDMDKVQDLMMNQLPKRGEQSKQLFLKCMLKTDQVHLLRQIITEEQIEQLKLLE